jgi:uncharacterized protein YjbI with pentapeptide repeats
MVDTQIPIFCGTFTITDNTTSPTQYLAVDAISQGVMYNATQPTDGSEVFCLYFVPWTNAAGNPNPANGFNYHDATQNGGLWLIASKLTGGLFAWRDPAQKFQTPVVYADLLNVSDPHVFLWILSDVSGSPTNLFDPTQDNSLVFLAAQGEGATWPMGNVNGQLGYVLNSFNEYGLTPASPSLPGLWTAMNADPSTNMWVDADFSFVDLRGTAGQFTGAAANWGNANLTQANLSGMDLGGATIGNAANLQGVNASGAAFPEYQNFLNANLSGANLSYVFLSILFSPDVNLGGCNLTGATFAGNQLGQALFENTILDGVDCTKASMPAPGSGGTNYFGQGSYDSAATFNPAPDANGVMQPAIVPASMFGSTWACLNLAGATIYTDAPVAGVNAAGAILDGATVAAPGTTSGAVLQKAVFNGASMVGTSLLGADLSGASFVDVLMYGAHFNGANLSGTTWSSAFAGCKGLFCSLPDPASGDVGQLNTGVIPSDLGQVMTQAGADLSNPSVVPRGPAGQWLITAGGTNYEVLEQGVALNVLSYNQTPATFDGAFLENAVLDNGNFAQASFNGVQWTGAEASGNADFEQADFTEANISYLTSGAPALSGGILFGAMFDDSVLINAGLSGAYLGVSANASANSFVSANLFQTCLAGANLAGVNLSNAIVEVSATGAATAFFGAPLFSMPASLAATLNNGGSAGPEVLAAFPPVLHVTSGTVKVIQESQQWRFSTADPASNAPGVIWSDFMILSPGGPGQNMLVYGTAFTLFSAVFGTDKLEQTLFSAGAPQQSGNPPRPVWLESQDMIANTTCPNGMAYGNGNQGTWDFLMTPENLGAITKES